MTSTNIIPAPLVGELTGLAAAAHATGDHTALNARVLQLHETHGYSSALLARVLDVPVIRVRAILKDAKTRRPV